MEATWRWVLVTAVAPVAWGSTYYVTREFLPADHPLFGAAVRALPAGLLLLLVCRTLPRGAWWWRSLVLGVLNTSGFFALVYLAAQLLPTSVAAVVMATSPVTMMLVAWAVLGRRPALLPVAGALLGIAGVVTMLLTGGGAVSVAGVAASVAAMLLSSVGYVLAQKWGGEVPVLASTAWQLVAGGLVILPVAVLVEGAPPVLDAPAVAGFAYVSLVATALAFTAWFTGLRHLDAGTVGLVGLLNPVTGVLLGTALAAEALTGRQAAGIALVLVGIAAGRPSRRRGTYRTRPPACAATAKPTAVRTQASTSSSGTGTTTANTRCSGWEAISPTATALGSTRQSATPSSTVPTMCPTTKTTAATAETGCASVAAMRAPTDSGGCPTAAPASATWSDATTKNRLVNPSQDTTAATRPSTGRAAAAARPTISTPSGSVSRAR